MEVVIPTCGRADYQPTLAALTKAGVSATLVVQAQEEDIYSRRYPHTPIVVLPPAIQTIAVTRQWILDTAAHRVVVMCDDDLTFYHRRSDDPTKLRDISPPELRDAFTALERRILESHTVALTGFAAREGANRNTGDILRNTRIMRVSAYDTAVLRDEDIRFDDVDLMEDFHVAVSLLRRGYENEVLNWVAHNQKSSGAAGGCSTYRTIERHNAAALRLQALHPRVVSVTEKQTKTAWGGQPRLDVTVQWKKALKDSL